MGNDNYMVHGNQCNCTHACFNIPNILKPSETTLTRRLQSDLINGTAWFDKHYPAHTSIGDRIGYIAGRCLAALAGFLCAVVDLMWWFGRTIIIFPIVKEGLKTHCSKFLSAISQIGLCWTMAAGYIPNGHVLINLQQLQVKRAQYTQDQRDYLDNQLRKSACFNANPNDGAVGLVQMLNEGADPNAKDAFGRTALMYAAARRNAENVEVLLDYGANLHEEVIFWGIKMNPFSFFISGIPIYPASQNPSYLGDTTDPDILAKSSAAIVRMFQEKRVVVDPEELDGLADYITAIEQRDIEEYKRLVSLDLQRKDCPSFKQILSELTNHLELLFKVDKLYESQGKPFANNLRIVLNQLSLSQ